jgi:hypothetical protein
MIAVWRHRRRNRNAFRTSINWLPFELLLGGPVDNRRFEVFEYRQVLARMRQGDSDRDIARAGLMGRRS